MYVLLPSATEYHLGLLKAKLAKYRAQLLEPTKSAGAKGEGFDVMKSGDARVALIGFPSVGKVRHHITRSLWFQSHITQSCTLSNTRISKTIYKAHLKLQHNPLMCSAVHVPQLDDIDRE